MKLYIVASWQGDGELDDIYLVRANEFREAAQIADDTVKGGERGKADMVCLIGNDCGALSDAKILMDPFQMLVELKGYAEHWNRDDESNWIDAEAWITD